MNVDVRGIVKEQIAAGEYGSPAFSGASWDPSVTEQATFTGYDDQVLSGTPWDPSKTERPALSGYDKFSIGAHITLSALGAIPVVGVGADLVDFGYTLGEKAFGKASWTDVSLSGAAIVASVLPGADQAVDAAKISKQLEKMSAGKAGELEILTKRGDAGFKQKIFRPDESDINSQLFKDIVGEAKYTKSGMLRGTMADFKSANVLEEVKLGNSVLKNSYQIRLQLYEAAKNQQQYILTTTRKIDPKLMEILRENNAFIRKPD